MPIWSHTNTIEEIQAYVVDSSANPLVGLTDLFARIQRVSDFQFFDWADDTFKAAGWATLDQIMAPLNATNNPGVYGVASGFDLSAITNKATSDTYVLRVIQSPGTNGVLPDPEEFREGNILGGGGGPIVGTGARQVTLHVETTTAVPIQGAQIDIFNNDPTPVFQTRVWTDVNGDVTVAIDDGTWQLLLFATGYSFTVPEFLVVTANATETYVGTAFVPPISANPNISIIYGCVRDAAGNPIAGACIEAFAVTPQILAPCAKGDRIIVTTTDVEGNFELPLERLTIVNFTIEGTDIDWERTVPDAPNQNYITWT